LRISLLLSRIRIRGHASSERRMGIICWRTGIRLGLGEGDLLDRVLGCYGGWYGGRGVVDEGGVWFEAVVAGSGMGRAVSFGHYENL
jgi:hypothetical protein